MSSLAEMKQRINYYNSEGYYNGQDDRNVKQKYLSFKSSLGNSYQAEWIELEGVKYRCLLNPDKLKETFDQKEISIDFNAGMQNGSYFHWNRTDTWWLVYMQDFAEEAYFRASARRCDHQIKINDNWYWLYVRGPSQMEIELGRNSGIEIADMSYMLHCYITDNEETRAFFERLKIVKFDNHKWRVSAVDRYSQKGVITFYLEEYRDNPEEDAMIVPEIIPPILTEPHIEGPQIIDYNIEYSYNVIGDVTGGTFSVTSKRVNIIKQTDKSCTIKIPKMISFREYFDLIYKIDDDNEIKLNILMSPI